MFPTPVSVLMPVCNEKDVIREVLGEWHRDVFRGLPDQSELVICDSSTDGTREILADIAGDRPYLRVLHSQREGFCQAALRLYRSAVNPLLFFTDGDGQYVASEFWKLTPHIHDHDLVHGYKARRQDPFYRLLASNVFNKLVRWYFPATAGSDVNSAFRLMHREKFRRLLTQICHLPTLVNAELYLRTTQAGLRIKNVPVLHRPRKNDVSRGLPPNRFVFECWKSWKGLRALRGEFRGPRAKPAMGGSCRC
jgi:glycosyltransferase involved in cell wall biosynthesis